MKLSQSKEVNRRIAALRKRCPWMASLIMHCLESRDPRAYEALRLLIERLREKAA
ncbi:MAG: hypothetical protein WC956_02495 [bacterium]